MTVLTKAFRTDGKVETSLIAQFYSPKKGPGQLWEALADEVRRLGGAVLTNCPVTQICVTDGRVDSVTAQTPDGATEFKADYYISSAPIKDLVGFMTGDEVPANVREVAEALPYRDFMTVGLLVKKLKLENKTTHKTPGNIVPDCWIYVQERDVKLGRLQIFNNWSPYMVKDPDHTVWIGLEYFCDEGDDFWNMSEADCVRMAAGELVKMGVLGSESEVLSSHREKVKKAYPAYFGSYSRMDDITACLDSFPNLYCIGRNGQHRYNNIDHSMCTAFETVKNLLSGETNKDNIWNVNTEKAYHEMKQESK
jgi:protoporphyrinogen oxidase